MGGHALFPDWSVYCATKAAVAHLTRNLRAGLGPRGVRVKNIEPGVTGTELGTDMRDTGMRNALTRLRSGAGPWPPRTSPRPSPSRCRRRRTSMSRRWWWCRCGRDDPPGIDRAGGPARQGAARSSISSRWPVPLVGRSPGLWR
ncbi:SDR family NAD(P)-dependent oxidoreductase [Streptomyces swartbergensis]|uniref:SDR family NAD(P)-dependent oxidoreductase n=1 Tax=Streptomyces swartbergensis TaxID=487165 RepID=UPI001FCA3467|nr:SDR family NAD(P)-dependent oxidoreductase [Streptomyces swartbergensis]